MNASLLLLYTATWSLVALTPGPAVMCVMGQATRYGWRASLIGVGGIQCGNLLFFGAVAGGLAALLHEGTIAFTILRYVGAIYLVYLGTRVILSTVRPRPLVEPPAEPGHISARRNLFVQGLLLQLTNPKALLFVSALLPQFVESDHPASLQLLALVVITLLVDILVLSSYALLAERGRRAFVRSAVFRWLERAFGATLVFFGARLVFSRN